MKLLLGIFLIFTAYLAVCYIIGRLFVSVVRAAPKKRSNKSQPEKKTEEETEPKVIEKVNNSMPVIKHNITWIKKDTDKSITVPSFTSSSKKGRFDNKIIQLHNASVRYPNTVHSSYDRCHTTLGVFEDPLFIDYGGEIVPCGYFRKKVSDGSDSFFFRFSEHDILINDYDNKTYHNSLFGYSVKECKFVSIYHNADTIISFKDYTNYIIQIWVSRDYFYYLDERSDFRLQKCLVPEGMHPSNAHISDDGKRFLFGKFGGQNSYMYDISSGMIKLMQKDSYNTFMLPDHQPDKPRFYHFYYSVDNSKNSQVMNKYLRMHPEIEYKIIDNEFEDDVAVNIDAKIPCNNKEAMDLCQYLNQSIKKYDMYGFSPSLIVDAAGETYRYYMYLYSKVTPEEKADCKEILEKIKEKHGYSDEQALGYIYNHYCIYEKVDPSFNNDRGKKIYQDVFQKMVDDGEVTTRWKSELQMYNVIHKFFDNSIFQYRDGDLLGLQSFDAYVPDLKIAFEYQGRQHYEPISFFGGEEGFARLRERDKTKAEICEQNGITLIYWKYDEPISMATLKRKLKEHNLIE